MCSFSQTTAGLCARRWSITQPSPLAASATFSINSDQARPSCTKRACSWLAAERCCCTPAYTIRSAGSCRSRRRRTPEQFIRTEQMSLVDRDHLTSRGYYLPVKVVVDGDLCETLARLPPAKQTVIVGELDRTVGKVL